MHYRELREADVTPGVAFMVACLGRGGVCPVGVADHAPTIRCRCTTVDDDGQTQSWEEQGPRLMWHDLVVRDLVSDPADVHGVCAVVVDGEGNEGRAVWQAPRTLSVWTGDATRWDGRTARAVIESSAV